MERAAVPPPAGGRARAAAATPGGAAPPVARVFWLRPGPGAERHLATGAVDVYQIELRAGQYLAASFDQRGVDLAVDLFGPGGRPLYRVDGLTGPRGKESVRLLAATAGRYRLEVVPVAGAGRYLARLEALRLPTAADAERAAAERDLYEAHGWDKRPPPGLREAAAELERAALALRRLGARDREAEARYRLGKLYLLERRFGEALAPLQGARTLFQRLGDRGLTALADNQIGKCFISLGELDKARQPLESALAQWRRQKVALSRAMTLENLGELDALQGRLPEALRFYREAAAVSRLLRDKANEAKDLTFLGWIYRSIGDVEASLTACWRACRLYRESRNWHAATALSQIGQTYLEQSEPRRALPFFERALQLLAGVEDRHARTTILSGLGISYQLLGDWDRALPTFRQAVEIYGAEGDRPSQVNAWINLGHVYRLMRRWRMAAGCFRQALDQAHGIGYRAAEALARLGAGQTERDRGDLGAALADGEAAVEIVEGLRADAARPDLKALYLAANEDYYGFLIDVLMRLHAAHPERGFELRALQESERLRARDLLDALTAERDSRSPDAAARALLAERERLGRQIAAADQRLRRLEANLETGGSPAAERAELWALIDRMHQLHQQIRGALAAAPPPDAALPRSLAGLQRGLLDERTVLLEYYMSSAKTFLWAVTRRKVASFELPGRDQLEPLLRSVYGWLAGGQPASDEAAGAAQAVRLSRILLGQVARQLGGLRLLIVANGPLQTVPFAALPDPDGGAEPLIVRHEILYAPSLAVLAELQARQRPSPPPRGLAILADPVFGGQDERLARLPAAAAAAPADPADPLSAVLPRLPQSRAEAAAIAALAGRRPLLQALGFDANGDLVRSGRLRGYEILHFATHGTLRIDRPELSALTLSLFDRDGRPRDGLLRAGEIADLELPARLVVLSACKTALGREVGDEGLVGLPQAFMKAGARQVLVSLWDVGDRSTAELMRLFYRGLLVEQREPAAALRAAQCAMRRDVRWRAPASWAGFVLQGDWR